MCVERQVFFPKEKNNKNSNVPSNPLFHANSCIKMKKILALYSKIE